MFERIIWSGCIMVVVWTIGGWSYGKMVDENALSWAIGIPIYLPVLLACWSSYRSIYIGASISSIYKVTGTIIFGILGSMCAFFVFMRIGSLSNGLNAGANPMGYTVEMIWSLAGAVAGGTFGGMIEGFTQILLHPDAGREK